MNIKENNIEIKKKRSMKQIWLGGGGGGELCSVSQKIQ